MGNIWTETNNNFVCNICGKKMERRIMSPFLSFKPSSVDWLAQINIPIYEDGEYRTGRLDVCPECYQRIAEAITTVKPKKKGKKEGTEQMAFDFA